MTNKRSFKKILIANRGEIALRVIRTARRLGYPTVAVFSLADQQARHVAQADQAVCIGGALPSQSYLNIPAIIEAAQKTGADAVHPGYGFLAENDSFAQACLRAGLVFIGPSPDSIRTMGNKAAAKALMIEAGVPCIPGYQGADQDAQHLAVEAGRIGYPVMIKAVAGGGGRGMRLVESQELFAEALASARSEAQNAFGDETVILERALVEPRHIEIQVFADRHGECIHLGERDCSVQRRHQKVIEEAPSPAVDAALREHMGATAVKAARAIRYEGAGTFEFLLDRDGSYYFMEMNTRLQVEHPVTEAITGLDLVELQLRIAAGESLPISQTDIGFTGHSIEVRLCAEDASNGFMPQSGRLLGWQVPEGLRVEHALDSNTEVSPYYDSMIAKLVSHGRDRDEARRKLSYGLQILVALGVRTNQEFLIRSLDHPVFARGQANTAFVEQHLDVLLERETSRESIVKALSAVLWQESGAAVTSLPGRRRLVNTLPICQKLSVDDTAPEPVMLEHLGERQYSVQTAADQFEIDLIELTGSQVRFSCDRVIESVAFCADRNKLWMSFQGRQFQVTDLTRVAADKAGDLTGADGVVRASMNGRVVAVLAREGDMVKANQPLLTIEAMKMEHIHVAPVAGLLKSLSVAVGEQVPATRVVAQIEATDR